MTVSFPQGHIAQHIPSHVGESPGFGHQTQDSRGYSAGLQAETSE